MAQVYWITGLSGVGKTPLAKKLTERLSKKNPTILIDGDQIREVLKLKFQNNINSRLKIAYIYSDLTKLIISQNINVVCSTISLFYEIQEYNRKNFAQYCEILIKKDIEKLISENKKNIYSNSVSGDDYAVGVNIKPEYPKNPSFVFDFNSKVNLESVVDEILNFKM
tara:strand:- start:261 stop:761 length:501 start_codon:yes stop_codon:yes gene_type:complete